MRLLGFLGLLIKILKTNTSLDDLNSEGDEVERWTLFNPIIVSANWGQFDYSSEELVELQLTIAYDYATIE